MIYSHIEPELSYKDIVVLASGIEFSEKSVCVNLTEVL